MARQTKEVKTPNPYTKDANTVAYFDNTGDNGIKCVAAALSCSSDCHIIICAPNIVELKKAWKHLVPTTPLDIKRTQVVLYKYGTELEQLQRDQLIDMEKELSVVKTAKLTSRPTRPSQTLTATEVNSELEKITKRNSTLYWFYEPAYGTVIQGYYADHNSEYKVRLGAVEVDNMDEARMLMRKLRISRTEIEKVRYDDDIPF